ncbi:MAG: ubiquinol-cytochrome c reductase iron-sulfur subunit [Pseudomonadota bacterium]|jgi:ubiquinol-cytochrome c reductase iron-sulfur subunit
MSANEVDNSKRNFLIAAGTLGVVAGGAAVIPFVGSMLPSERAKAAGAPIEVDISKIEPGQIATFEWRGKPVWVVNRTPEMLAQLEKNSDKLADPASGSSTQPAYAKNALRANEKNKNFLVVEGVCTHLGCSPTFRKDIGPADLGTDWPGGFYCPCHGSKFDLAARVFKGSPAPSNMVVPPYQYLSDSRLMIGDDSKGA